MAGTGRTSKSRGVPKDVDAYLAGVPPRQRAALERLRRIIRAAAPEAEEVISYRIPAYKQDGMLVGFAAAENHCTFHLMSTEIMKPWVDRLAGYSLGRGSIRFAADEPLPASLVTKLVKARLGENAAHRKS